MTDSTHSSEPPEGPQRSFVCGLCDEWTDWLPRRFTIEPDKPSNVRETAEICKACSEAIKSTEKTNNCVWCGDGTLFVVWDLTHPPVGGGGATVPGSPQAAMCSSCWAKACKKYPQELSDDLKESVRESQNRVCGDCGMPESIHEHEFGQKLHIHHIDGDKHNNQTNNLVALCARCHGSR